MRTKKQLGKQYTQHGKGKILLQTIFTTLAFFISIASVCADSQIRWKDVNSGLQEGKQSHKYVLVDVYTEWCGWCKSLDRDTFSNQDLIHFLESKFVCVKANAEDNGPGQKMAGEYGVNGYPCALVFDQNGKLIGRIIGYKDANGYQTALSNVLINPSTK